MSPSRPSQPVLVQEFLGRWIQVGGATAAGILAVHAALLPTGKIVYLGGDQHDSGLNAAGEVTGLLALMLLTEARRPARIRADGALVPLAEQDRTLWDRPSIEAGTELISRALTRGRVGPYHLQAAIAAVHAEAHRISDTDWPQIVALYELLERVAPNPLVTLNRAVALAMWRGPEAGLALLAQLDGGPRLAGHHRLDAVRAHLLATAVRVQPA